MNAEPTPRPRHSWLIGDSAAATELAMRLDGARLVTLWGTRWRPERLFSLLDVQFTLTAILEGSDLTQLRAAEAQIATDPARFHILHARMVLVTPHQPSLARAELDAAGIAVFSVGWALEDGVDAWRHQARGQAMLPMQAGL